MKTFESAGDVEGADKYVHFTFYFVFTFLWYLFLRNKKWSAVKTRMIVFLFGFLFGLLIEACQGAFTKDRSADLHDVLANTSGSAGAVLILWLVSKLSKKQNY